MNKDELVRKVPPKRSLEIDALANATLIQLFGFPQNALQPLAFFNFFDRGGLTKLGLDYGVEELVGEEAHYDASTNEIILDAKTFDALSMDNPRAKFTLAHEIGHAKLHGPYFRKELLQGRTSHRQFPRKTLPAYEDPEWQANRFAGAFLMPTSLMIKAIREGWSDKRIADFFGVSISAAQRSRQKIKIS